MTILVKLYYDTGHYVTRRLYREENIDPLFYGNQQAMNDYMTNLLFPVINIIGMELDAKQMTYGEWNTHELD